MLFKFLLDYIIWHYTKGLSDLVKNIKNFIWLNNFVFDYKLLFSTLFSNLMRLGEDKIDYFDYESVLKFIIINTIMRFIGFIIRIILILIGFVLLLLTIIFSLILLILWITLPILIIFLLIFAINLILK